MQAMALADLERWRQTGLPGEDELERNLEYWRQRGLPGEDDLPSEDGEPMETGFHDAQAALLKDTLLDAWRDRNDVFVAGNMFVYFSDRQLLGEHFRGPDVFVVMGVDAKGRKSWVAWKEEGRLPDVVIELISHSTEAVDRGVKMDIYAQVWRTGTYALSKVRSALRSLDRFRWASATVGGRARRCRARARRCRARARR